MPSPMTPLQQFEAARYSAVRAGGWSFDHTADVWRHAHTGRTGLNQHVIYECLRNHDAMPPCGNTRAETLTEDRHEWVRRAARLREIERAGLRIQPMPTPSRYQVVPATAASTEEQTNGEFTIDSAGHTVRNNNADAEVARDRRYTVDGGGVRPWSTSPLLNSNAQAVSRATVRPRARSQASRGKLCRVSDPMWEA